MYKNGDQNNSDQNAAKIGQDTEMCPGDLNRYAVTKIAVKNTSSRYCEKLAWSKMNSFIKFDFICMILLLLKSN